MAPSTSSSWLCQAPMRFTIRWAAYAGSTEAMSHGQAFGEQHRLRIAADAAAESHQKRRINGHQVGSADDGLGHVLGQRDAAGNDQRDLVSHAPLHQPAMNVAQGVFDVTARSSVVEALAPMPVGTELEDLDARLPQFERSGRQLAVVSVMRTQMTTSGYSPRIFSASPMVPGPSAS